MGSLFSSCSSKRPNSLVFLCALLFSASSFLLPISESATDYKTLVYKGCAKQMFVDPSGVYSQALSALFGSLVSQSTKAKFYKTTSGSGQTNITGLFQCRGDLSNSDCYNCVSGLPILSDKLCGKTIAARVQLYGCYLLYEVAGFAEVSGDRLDLLSLSQRLKITRFQFIFFCYSLKKRNLFSLR